MDFIGMIITVVTYIDIGTLTNRAIANIYLDEIIGEERPDNTVYYGQKAAANFFLKFAIGLTILFTFILFCTSDDKELSITLAKVFYSISFILFLISIMYRLWGLSFGKDKLVYSKQRKMMSDLRSLLRRWFL